MNIIKQDRYRYSDGKMPKFQKYFRRCQNTTGLIKILNKILYKYYMDKNHIEISSSTKIGPGLYIGHPYCITINANTVIGKNCNIHKGVTIGQENRGKRNGTPVIGDSVWIGINATIVGNVTIGDDVLIAPNSYVNCDIPSHSVVIGNPCFVKPVKNATIKYINRKV